MIRNNFGFTLLESLITGAIAMVVIAGFISLNSYFARQQRTLQMRANANDFIKKVEAIVNQRAEKLLTP